MVTFRALDTYRSTTDYSVMHRLVARAVLSKSRDLVQGKITSLTPRTQHIRLSEAQNRKHATLDNQAPHTLQNPRLDLRPH